MEIKINNLNDIEKVSSLLHDATFSKEDLHYNNEQKIFHLNATRFMWERTEKKGLFRTLKAPWIKCKLELQEVLEYKINEYESVDTYEFSSIEVREKNLLIIQTAVGIEIQLKIGEIKGFLQDIGK